MAYCRKCGAQIDDEAVICPHCGVEQVPGTLRKNDNDDGSFIWAVIGFLLPIIGILLFAIWHSDRPKSAKMAGMGALVSILASVIIVLIVLVIMAVAIGTNPNVILLQLI